MTDRLHYAAAALLAALAMFALAPTLASAATADLGVDLSDSPDPVTAGSELAYTITVANAGPDPATGVVLDDGLASKLAFVSATPSQGSCGRKGKKVSCPLGAIESGAEATVEIRVVPEKAGQIANTATVTSADTDPAPANDSDTETTTVVEPPPAPTCAGHKATVVGTEGADELTGTPKRDVIASLGGDDIINALEGNDIVCAAAGDDVVRGKAGADLLRSGGGSDRVKGGGDADTLRAGGGADQLSGGPAADLLRGGGGRDSCVGGPGRDTERSC